MTMRPCAAILATLLGLAGCQTVAAGPVLGDWRGRQPTGDGLYPSYVDLVLHGAPGATAGDYDFQANLMAPTLTNMGERNVTWGDRWTLAPAAPGALPVLELHDLPSSQIARYALLPNGLLVPLTRSGQPDTSRYSLHYALQPVPRNDRSFGRL